SLLYTVSAFGDSDPPYTRGLYVHDVSNPATATQLSYTQLFVSTGAPPYDATSVGVFGNMACAVAGTMHVLDVSNPAAPIKRAESQNYHSAPDYSTLLRSPFMYGVSGYNPAGVIIDLVALPGDFDGDL